MTRFEYEQKMLWARFWLAVLGLWHKLPLPTVLPNTLYGWIISQCGFVYMGTWEMAKGDE